MPSENIIEYGDRIAGILREYDAIAIEDIIGRGEIRSLAGGVTHRTLQQWRAGLNLKGAGPFPEPIRELESGPLFDRRAVCAWLERH
jgi:hypothetical protein